MKGMIRENKGRGKGREVGSEGERIERARRVVRRKARKREDMRKQSVSDNKKDPQSIT